MFTNLLLEFVYPDSPQLQGLLDFLFIQACLFTALHNKGYDIVLSMLFKLI